MRNAICDDRAMKLDSVKDRLQWARKQAFPDKTATEVARGFGWPISTYLGHENGDRTPSRPTAKKYASRFKVRWEWLLEGGNQPTAKANTIPVEGYVGAGAEFIPFEDGNLGLGDAPVQIEPNSSAVIVRGDSMYPRYFDGEYLYYTKDSNDPAVFLGQECVIKLHDGRMFVKILRKSTKKGHFNLESWNSPTIEDQMVEWAAPVTWRRG